MAELLPLAIAAAFWPVLLAVVLVALRAPHPAKLLICFLAGGLLATMTEGLLIIYALNGSSLVTSDQSTTDPVVDVIAGALALVIAYIMVRREKPPAPDGPKEESEYQQTHQGHAGKGCGLGIRGWRRSRPLAKPVCALRAQGSRRIRTTASRRPSWFSCFYLIVFVFIELPLIGYLVASERAAARTVRFNAWITRSWYRLAIYAFLFCGVYLIAKGIYEYIA